MTKVTVPLAGKIIELVVSNGDHVSQGQTVLVLESMKVHVKVEATASGQVSGLAIAPGDQVQRGQTVCELKVAQGGDAKVVEFQKSATAQASAVALDAKRLHDLASDENRAEAVAKRHAKGYLSARENLALYCSADQFREFGRLAVAAQSSRYSQEELRQSTAADAVITGLGWVHPDGTDQAIQTSFVINDYSVLAGTQGFYHHAKIDRMLEVAEQQQTPVVMYTEGGGGRPGDTDVIHINSGLTCSTFSNWARLRGVVPRICVANGYNFAGNAALFGAADVTIGTANSWVGMAGPAMIAGGGLGEFKPTDIGPSAVQAKNGVLDIVADDEKHAASLVRCTLGHLCGLEVAPQQHSADQLDSFMPANRKLTYSIRDLLTLLCDADSLLELRQHYGGAVATFFARIGGQSLAILASDCAVNGGAVDVAAGRKAANFMRLCTTWEIPLAILSDTPGFMVGPEHEELGAVRELADLFDAGAKLTVPTIGIVLRKCYGLGGQALLGGSTKIPDAVVAWPTGEFGAMGLEGAVQLGFKKELAACPDEASRETLFAKLVGEQYRRGAATQVATVLEIDAVIKPSETRQWLSDILFDQTLTTG